MTSLTKLQARWEHHPGARCASHPAPFTAILAPAPATASRQAASRGVAHLISEPIMLVASSDMLPAPLGDLAEIGLGASLAWPLPHRCV